MKFERPEIIRPPSEWNSYYLPLTSGCSNNTCTFCSWNGCRLRIRDIEEVKREIDAMALYRGHGIHVEAIPHIVYLILDEWDGRKVFLQDGDALVYPMPKLVEALDYLNSKFPGLERIASYATPMDLLRTSIEELKMLKEKKLGILYMGIESGDDEVLQRVCKGVNHDQIVEAGKKVKESGILLSVTVILGLGGKELSEQHVRETSRILNEIDPDYAGALTLTLYPNVPLYKQLQSGDFVLVSPFDSLKELRTLIETSNYTHCFFSSMHASNYVPVRGYLPEDKNRMIKQLDAVLNEQDISRLRPEYLRGL